MNVNIETRKLYASWYSLHHDVHIPWRRIRLRPVFRHGHWYTMTSIGDPFCVMYGESQAGSSPREATAALRSFLRRDIRSQRGMQAALPAFRARLENALATHPPKILSHDERAWCNANDITIGYDTDDERFCPKQLSHLMRNQSALCDTAYIWFGGGEFNSPRGDGVIREEDNEISCPLCLREFERLL